MLTLLDRFRAHVARARLFPAPGAAIVAVSGGPDSVALLDLLAGVAPDFGLTIVVAHVDHGMRADSRMVGSAVGKLAQQHGLPFETVELKLGPNATETGARRARYAWLRDVQARHGARYLVTAHHRDDQIETVLLRVLRGSAPAGLAGMAARARGGLVRPLLDFTRAELTDYASARRLPVHDDPANRDPRHLRSWIRVDLLPRLTERLGDRVLDDLSDLRRHAARDRRAWARALELVPELEFQRHADGFAVARGVLLGYDNALSVALLRAAARRVGCVLGPKKALRVLALARRPSGRGLALGSGWTATVEFDRLRLTQGPPPGKGTDVPSPVIPSGARGVATFGTFEVRWTPDVAPARVERAGWTTWIEARREWEVRPAEPGDALVPLGGVGHRPLRRLLMEARVPRRARARYPVVARGATILWVPGICRSADGVPAPGTEAVRLDVTEHGTTQEADGGR